MLNWLKRLLGIEQHIHIYIHVDKDIKLFDFHTNPSTNGAYMESPKKNNQDISGAAEPPLKLGDVQEPEVDFGEEQR